MRAVRLSVEPGVEPYSVADVPWGNAEVVVFATLGGGGRLSFLEGGRSTRQTIPYSCRVRPLAWGSGSARAQPDAVLSVPLRGPNVSVRGLERGGRVEEKPGGRSTR